MTAAEIEQRQCNRFVVLYEAYKLSKGNTDQAVDLLQPCADRGVKNGNFNEASNYLYREDFLQQGHAAFMANITHAGKKIVEYIVTHPNERTDQFPSFKDMCI